MNMAGSHRSSGGGISTFLTGAWLGLGGRERGTGGRHSYGRARAGGQGWIGGRPAGRHNYTPGARTQLAARNTRSTSMFAYSQAAGIRSGGGMFGGARQATPTFAPIRTPGRR